MYQDPTKIRKHVVKIRLSDREERLIQALVDFTGAQKATLIRDIVLGRARSLVYDTNVSQADR